MNEAVPASTLVVTRKFVDVAWVEDGMTVWLRWDRKTINGREYDNYVRCKVIVAAGNHARIVNEARDLDTWKRLDELSVEDGDPHAYGEW